jgi:hypothetical protein
MTLFEVLLRLSGMSALDAIVELAIVLPLPVIEMPLPAEPVEFAITRFKVVELEGVTRNMAELFPPALVKLESVMVLFEEPAFWVRRAKEFAVVMPVTLETTLPAEFENCTARFEDERQVMLRMMALPEPVLKRQAPPLPAAPEELTATFVICAFSAVTIIPALVVDDVLKTLSVTLVAFAPEDKISPPPSELPYTVVFDMVPLVAPLANKMPYEEAFLIRQFLMVVLV